MTQLTLHFTLEEMSATQVRGVDNTPPADVIPELRDTAMALEVVRELLGNLPIHVNSGFRAPEVNQRVGGAENSAHLYGWAADFICPQFGTPLDICRAIAGSDIDFDQLIEEGTWVHLSVKPTMRRQVLTKNPAGGYYQGLPPTVA